MKERPGPRVSGSKLGLQFLPAGARASGSRLPSGSWSRQGRGKWLGSRLRFTPIPGRKRARGSRGSWSLSAGRRCPWACAEQGPSGRTGGCLEGAPRTGLAGGVVRAAGRMGESWEVQLVLMLLRPGPSSRGCGLLPLDRKLNRQPHVENFPDPVLKPRVPLVQSGG